MSDRRTFLAGLAAAATTATGKRADAEPLVVPEYTKVAGALTGASRYGSPSPFENHVFRQPTRLAPNPLSSWTFTPLHQLQGTITPNGLFFERHHAGVPAIDPKSHWLVVHGLVQQPIKLTMDDLVRFPAVTRTHFIECSGNGGAEWRQPFGETIAQTHGLLSCAQWTGVLVSTVLEECGVKARAKWVIAEGADGAAMNRSVPVDVMLDDALIAYGQNGEALRPEQGYPIRLILPGREGNTHIKWLRRLEVTDGPVHSREETAKYTDLMPDGRAAQFTLRMGVKSVIVRPSAGVSMGPPGFYEIRGLAWSGHGRIRRVEVSIDGGRRWQDARLEEPIRPKCLTQFRWPWRFAGRAATLMSRATDERGNVQPSRQQLVETRGLNSVYHYNAIQAWRVEASGAVTNVHA